MPTLSLLGRLSLQTLISKMWGQAYEGASHEHSDVHPLMERKSICLLCLTIYLSVLATSAESKP